MRDVTVISVGMCELPFHSILLETFRSAGASVLDLATHHDLRQALRDHRRVAIVVYSEHGSDGAHRVLKELASALRAAPVVVVVNKAELGEYHELMTDGALCYCEASEGPQRIGAAVECLASKRAA